jgi:hypothetical protein
MNRRISFVLVLRVFEMKQCVETSLVESYAYVIFIEFFFWLTNKTLWHSFSFWYYTEFQLTWWWAHLINIYKQKTLFGSWQIFRLVFLFLLNSCFSLWVLGEDFSRWNMIIMSFPFFLIPFFHSSALFL